MRARPGLASLALMWVAACGDTRVGSEASLPDAQLVETLRIGSIDDPDQALTRVGGVLPMPDGGIWVVQPEDAEIRVFSPEGTLVHRVGGSGQGPGEFTIPGAIGFVGAGRDSIWVADAFLGRITIFGADGGLGRTIAAPPVTIGDTLVVEEPDAFTREHGALALATYTRRADEWGHFPIVSYEPGDTVEPEEIARVERTPRVQIRWRGAVLAQGAHPVSDAPLVHFTPDGRVYIITRDADFDTPVRVIALDAAGDTLWTREYARDPIEIPRTESDSIYAAQIERFQSFTRLEGRVSDEDAAAAYRSSVRIPAHRPPVRHVVGAPDGRLWLGWSAAPGDSAEWWVLDREGEPVVRFGTPGTLDVRAADGDRLWGVATDSMGVPYIIRYELRES